MEINRCVKESFSVIGKEGSTMDGSGFIQRLWEDANSHFQEIEYLAKRDGNGAICGIWGAMSDLSHSFKPWEDNFTKGLYLAGVEAKDGEEAPEGWTVWRIPGYGTICHQSPCASTGVSSAFLANTAQAIEKRR